MIKTAIVMGSASDREIALEAVETLGSFGVETTVRVLSAHRTPLEAYTFAQSLEAQGVGVVIAFAGMAAHLAGAVAAHTILPVIGVPVCSGGLGGMDALLSTVQMPSGIPVAAVAVNGAKNAALLAVEILALQDALLTPTRIYVKPMLKLFGQVAVKGVAHITGGGFFENIPRNLPQGFGAFIETEVIRTPPLFGMIAREGDIPRHEMFATFNMGVGLCVTVEKGDADRVLRILREAGEEAYIFGEVRVSGEPLTLC